MGDFAYRPEEGRYRYAATGRLVPDRAIRAYLANLVQAGQDRLLMAGQRLASGQDDVLAFRERAQAALKDMHLSASSLAHGGWARMDARTRGAIGARLRGEYDYLAGLALDWSQGRLSEAQLAGRLGLFAGQGHATYEQQRRRDGPERGDEEEYNVLAGGADHCGECPGLSGRWVPRGTLPLPGSRACLGRCRCRIITRPARQAGVAA
jgi:hypothetical protein